jgi:hypothetical protein
VAHLLLLLSSAAVAIRGQEGSMENQNLVQRVRSEFLEMPGLRLTPAQAARLWHLDSALCQQIIDCLVGSAFLRWTSTGAIVRAER